MLTENMEWFIAPSEDGYKNAQKDKRFPYIVALGRAVNALNFVRSLAVLRSSDENSPAAKRDRMNSYLFGSAIMYEALELIKKMNKPFATDARFQNGLRQLLKDKDAQFIATHYLNPVRNRAVFHFDPERFDETVQAHHSPEKFCSGKGKKAGAVNFNYSDIITVEILTGSYGHSAGALEDFGSVVARTDALTGKFVGFAADLIREVLASLNFQIFADNREVNPF